ncbi:MAG: hypothetical protein KUG77_08975 [Nannocystaceae bacterium]|nr:hypothetical protein [Nannocystaceae bacterium]
MILALAHVYPAAVAVAPRLVESLYGVAPGGSAALLLQHRGALFLAVALAAGLASFDPAARRAASLTVGVSVISYLAIYVRAGAPLGPLRSIAWVDVVLLLPLAIACRDAWWGANSSGAA